MKTLKISKEEMLKRVSVFKDLKPLPIQLDKNIPQEGKDIVYARELLSIIGLENNSHNTPINKNAPITGAAGITMTISASSWSSFNVDDAFNFRFVYFDISYVEMITRFIFLLAQTNMV